MSIFCYKKIDPFVRLSDRLRQEREATGHTPETISDVTRIPLRYVQALESGEFQALPKTTAHRLAYVRAYAEAVGLAAKAVLDQFRREAGVSGTPSLHPHRTLPWFSLSSLSIVVRNAFLLGCVALFAGYLFWHVRGILQPPELLVYTPIEGNVLTAPSTIVQGETERESRLTVNGQEIMVMENGKFEAKIDLSPGLNTIVIASAKKHGKTTTVTRHLVLRAPDLTRVQ